METVEEPTTKLTTATPDATDLVLTPDDHKRLALLRGQCDANLNIIEETLGIEITPRSNLFRLNGSKTNVAIARDVLETLYRETKDSTTLNETQVRLVVKEKQSNDADLTSRSHLAVRTRHGAVKARTTNQQAYIDCIKSSDLTFGVGPAGTGKTFLAIACAIEALEAHQVQRIILARPAVEAGERLGFLPGDLSQKIDPYCRPLYDALFEMLGVERVSKMVERQIIEVAPLAYMRGRTLTDSFIILDEAQNTTTEQMKMFLTRMGYNCTVVVTGDVTQIDLPRGQTSGLTHSIKVLHKVPQISFIHFKPTDVVRHSLVQKIIEAYEKSDDKRKS